MTSLQKKFKHKSSWLF